MARRSKRKPNTLTLNLGGRNVQVTESPELLEDLGGFVFFGTLAQKAKDDGNDEVLLYAGAIMVEFAKRCLKQVEAKQGKNDAMYMAWAHALEWVSSALDIGKLSPESQSSALARVTDLVRPEEGRA